jgi:uncharacterized protein HemX
MSDKQKVNTSSKGLSSTNTQNKMSKNMILLIACIFIIILVVIGFVIYYYIKYNKENKINIKIGTENMPQLDSSQQALSQQDLSQQDLSQQDLSQQDLSQPTVNININDTEALLKLAGIDKE